MALDQHFNSPQIVSAYNRGRPLYPSSVINFLINNKLLRDGDVLADLGTGNGRFLSSLFNASSQTGQSISLQHIHAVDSSKNMLAEVDKEFSDVENLTSHHGTFQELPLESNSVDVITCFSSLHWGTATKKDAEATKREIARVLRPNGRIIVSNDYWGKASEFEQEINKLRNIASQEFNDKFRPDGKLKTGEQWKVVFNNRHLFAAILYYALKEKYFSSKFTEEDHARLEGLSKKFGPVYRLTSIRAGDIFDKNFIAQNFDYTYPETRGGIIAEHASQTFIDKLSPDKQNKFYSDLKQTIQEYHGKEDVFNVQRTCFIVAGKFNF